MDPQIAAACLSEDLGEFLAAAPRAAVPGWCRHETGDPLRVVVGIPARQLVSGGPRRVHHVHLDATYYDDYPVRVTFVERADQPDLRSGSPGEALPLDPCPTSTGQPVHLPRPVTDASLRSLDPEGAWRRARAGGCGLPVLESGLPIEFAIHDSFTLSTGQFAGVECQLVCFSYSFDYYVSGHNPTANQQWRPGQDRVHATLNRLFDVLNSPAYTGPAVDPAVDPALEESGGSALLAVDGGAA